MTTLRIAALWIADFSVWAMCGGTRGASGDCGSRDVRRQAIVIGGIPPERGTVLALSDEARRLGLRVGMTLAQAQAVLPAARFVRPDEARLRRERVALTELLHTFVPKVERADDDGLFYLDLRGLERLYATETELAKQVRAAVFERGYPAAVGIASTKEVAAIAAREAHRQGRTTREAIVVVGVGCEAQFLRPLPIDRLPIDERLLQEVLALGLITIGSWAALPAAAIAARFGSHGRALHALARGIDESPLQPTRDAHDLAVAVALDEPLLEIGLLAFHLKRATDTLCIRLAARGLKTTVLRLDLALDDHSQEVRQARLTRPTASAQLLLDCLRIDLQRTQLAGLVVGFTLRAVETTAARAEQRSLFASTAMARSDEDLGAFEQALARVRAMVGDGGIVSPRPGDTHRPEEQLRWEPWRGLSSDRRSASRRRGREAVGLAPVNREADPPPGPALRDLPARLLPTPHLAEVRVIEDKPVFFACEHHRGQVVEAVGPHRIEGEWWGKPYARDYYNLRLDDGRYWVFREEGEWYLHGVFD